MLNNHIQHTESLNQNINSELISLLYSKSVARPALHIISLIIFVLIIINHVNPVYACTWAILLAGLNIYRFIDIKKTQQQLEHITDYKTIQRRYALSAGLLGAIYSVGIVVFFDQLPLLNQMFALTMVSTLMPAGLVSFATDRLTFYAYIYSLTIPIIIRLFMEGQFVYLNLGISAVIYVLIMRKLFIWNYNVIKDAIKVKLENQDLLDALTLVNNRLMELSVIDDLTQVANRRSLDETLEKEWLRAKRSKMPISMLMIDIDHFKQYNDEFGHLKGDECLVHIADFMKNNLNRPTDFVARYGGEEFSIIMPDTNMNGALNLAERIHSGIRDLKIPNPASPISKFLTVSVGVASVIPAVNESHMDLIYTSDRALYQAKSDGRNIIRSIVELEKSPKPKLVS